MTQSKPLNVLFVCVENSNRSQMAEAFARLHGGDQVHAYSAGSQPSGVVNTKAIKAMAELNYDLSTHQSLSLHEVPDITFDFVATMGCGDACPLIQAQRREDWAIPDPRVMDENQFRAVRDEIAVRVRSMLDGLLNQPVAR